MIDIFFVGRGVKCHSPSYWSIVVTSPVKFSTARLVFKKPSRFVRKLIILYTLALLLRLSTLVIWDNLVMDLNFIP